MSKKKKTIQVKTEAATSNFDSVQPTIALNEGQLGVLNMLIPGFKSLTPEHAYMELDRVLPVADSSSLSRALKERAEDVLGFYNVVAYGAIYSKISSNRKTVLREVDRIRTFYLADVIVNQIVEDALAPEVSDGDIIDVYSDNEDIQLEIEKLDEIVNFNALVADISPDLVAYGEYTLKNEIGRDSNGAPMGIVSVDDTVEQDKVVAVTKAGEIEIFVEEANGRIYLREVADFTKFMLGYSKIRVDLHAQFEGDNKFSKALKKVPRYIRIGRSTIYPILPKLKELELLEQLVPAGKISKMSAGSLVGVQMPPGMKITDAMEAASRLESVINKKIGVDMQKRELTLEAIMSTAGRIRCIPMMGDNKGQMTKLDYKMDEADDLMSTNEDVRKVICSSAGIPYEIIFGASEDVKKSDLLKRYARYVRRLKAVQKALSDGIKQMVYVHLANKGTNGVKFKRSDIKVSFRNKLVEVDNLDRIEFADTTIGYVKGIMGFMDSLSESQILKDVIDPTELHIMIKQHLDTIGLGSIIKDPEVHPSRIGKGATVPPNVRHPIVPERPTNAVIQANQKVVITDSKPIKEKRYTKIRSKS